MCVIKDTSVGSKLSLAALQPRVQMERLLPLTFTFKVTLFEHGASKQVFIIGTVLSITIRVCQQQKPLRVSYRPIKATES